MGRNSAVWWLCVSYALACFCLLMAARRESEMSLAFPGNPVLNSPRRVFTNAAPVYGKTSTARVPFFSLFSLPVSKTCLRFFSPSLHVFTPPATPKAIKKEAMGALTWRTEQQWEPGRACRVCKQMEGRKRREEGRRVKEC